MSSYRQWGVAQVGTDMPEPTRSPLLTGGYQSQAKPRVRGTPSAGSPDRQKTHRRESVTVRENLGEAFNVQRQRKDFLYELQMISKPTMLSAPQPALCCESQAMAAGRSRGRGSGGRWRAGVLGLAAGEMGSVTWAKLQRERNFGGESEKK